MNELPVIQKTYDLIKWTVPILNKLSRDHKYLVIAQPSKINTKSVKKC